MLSGIGLGMTVVSSLFTYRLMHEPLEAVGASVIDHMGSSTCAAIARTLSALSLASRDAERGESPGERTPPDPNATVGVVTTGSWELKDFHPGNLTRMQSLAILQRLPLAPQQDPQAEAVRQALQNGASATAADLRDHRCEELGYGLNPLAVRVYTIPGRPEGWLAFLYGPLSNNGQTTVAFALVDLTASTVAFRGHDDEGTMQELFPGDNGQAGIGVQLHAADVLSDPDRLHQVIPKLDLVQEDQHLMGLKIVPFANRLVSSQLSIDHPRLDQIARRAAGLVFLIGLLASGAVVIVSRRSELQLRQLNEALLRESRTDGLTRIANRRAWDEALSQEESRRQRHGHHYGLVVIDLDGFKQINDQQGHQMGDQVLQIAARKLAEELRSTDLLARVGGDEFAVLLFNPTAAGLEELLDRLKTSLETSGIEASIGAALSEERTTLEQTWAKADDAMYAVKTGTGVPLLEQERSTTGTPGAD